MAKIVSRGDPIEPIYLNNLRVAAHGWGVVSGLAVSQRGAGANMSVDVAAGEAWINGTNVTKGSITNVAITAAHASYDRYDLVVINSSGTISVIDGTAAATSYANDYDLETNNAILLAEVYVPATDTTIEDAQITNKQIISFMEEIVFGISLEEYSNHFGNTDNFMETNVSGTGATATEDATNHEMDLVSGTGSGGYANYISKDSWILGTKPIVVNMMFDNLVPGASSSDLLMGLKNIFSSPSTNKSCVFCYDAGTAVWKAVTGHASNIESTTITSPSPGDVLTIVATSSKVLYFVNGVVVATHTLYIPVTTQYFGAVVVNAIGSPSSLSVSIDYINFKRYA